MKCRYSRSSWEEQERALTRWNDNQRIGQFGAAEVVTQAALPVLLRRAHPC